MSERKRERERMSERERESERKSKIEKDQTSSVTMATPLLTGDPKKSRVSFSRLIRL